MASVTDLGRAQHSSLWDTTMALTMGGRSEGLIRKHLLGFGLSPAAATSGLERVLKTTAPLIPQLESGVLPFD